MVERPNRFAYQHAKEKSMKVCSKCGIEKDIELFAAQKYRDGKRRSTCQECILKQKAEHRKNPINKKNKKELHQTYYQKPGVKEKQWESGLKNRYNMTAEQYRQLLIFQNNRCAICDIHELETAKKRLCVDHSHNTGVVRGLLCMPCNSAIGLLKDKSNIVRKAADYLDKKQLIDIDNVIKLRK